MKILAVGGGSGGHVTPVVAVLKELRAEHPRVELRMWCDRNFAAQARSIVSTFDASLPVQTIAAGKFRRYYHLSFWQHITWPSLVFQNIGDAFLVGAGFVQSLVKLLLWRPDVVFTKGGYVCLPVGMAARVLKIPLVIHDSDAHPGLTNRVLSRWATAIGTGAPLEYYSYPKSRSAYVGIPIKDQFRSFTAAEQKTAKGEWGVSVARPLVVVTGGGLGAKRLNDVIVASLEAIKERAAVVLVAGAGQYDSLRVLFPEDTEDFQLYPFINNMDRLLGAADVVVARAGATTILELAALEKPTVLVPNGKLTGGHQLKNAAVYADANAAIVLDENDLEADKDLIVRTIAKLIEQPKEARAMARRFAAFARPDAAKDMAAMILAARRR